MTASMLRPAVQHMAALAERRGVGIRVVARVVVPWGQYHTGHRNRAEILNLGLNAQDLAITIAPRAHIPIPPPPVAEMVDFLPVRASAALTRTTAATETDRGGDLQPNDRRKEMESTPNRHRGLSSLTAPSIGTHGRARQKVVQKTVRLRPGRTNRVAPSTGERLTAS